ncbi:MAG: ankyrin repeat domain-containing protein, partial [Syntrophales bacterium]|nr:ankyrin repeat domain-containing protein [Syntrophales bacterium]
MIRAAAYGQIDVVKDLLDKGADVNEWSGSTPLLAASGGGHANVVKLLIERGANVNTMTNRGDSALGIAATRGHMNVVQILIDNGANINAAITGLEQRSVTLAEYPDWLALYKMGIKRLENIVKKQEIASRPAIPVLIPSQEVSPAIRSDIEELPLAKVKPNKTSYAIVIGIENYRQKLPKADYAVADAKTVTEYLIKAMGYPEENIITLTNEHATNVDFAKYFEKWLPNNVEKDSSVFIYYSGHGAPNTKTGDAYLVPYDGDPSFIEQTGYPLKKLYESLNKLQVKEIIVALDSCFSGAGGRSVLAKGSRPLVMNLQSNMVLSKNMTVLSASSGDQTSSTYDEKGHGLFT